MANIKDVAKKAGVGIATVSRVLNNSGYVKESTSIRIKEAIKELNYIPNEIARSLINQSNKTIAFILPNSMHLFFGELLYYTEEYLFDMGYKVLLCNSSGKRDKEIYYLEMLKNNRVDGVILLTTNDIEEHLDSSLPIISFDSIFEDIPFVSSDNYMGGKLAAKRLIDNECGKILYLGKKNIVNKRVYNTNTVKRKQGFLDQMFLNEIDVSIYEYTYDQYQNIDILLSDYFDKNIDFDGIFAMTDELAFKVANIYKEKAILPGKDISIIGFDGGRSYQNTCFNLTSINQDSKELAKALSEMIVEKIKKNDVKSTLVPVKINDGDTA
ncbi:LacI family DNA-binding transcriptional regulator [Candidatus Izimaplasma bacterium ZiA1]|uniref:LacI family DNA-binding transcriptional regulator n=1 Tax=Candidatus Izimoplasma sp. ZiA1 TaxID=2024899 RepID=UPI0014387AA5